MAPDSTASQLPDNPTVPQVVDFIWERFDSVIQSHHRKEISLPAELKTIIGDHGIQVLVDRFSQAIEQPIKTELVETSTSSTIRFRATEGPYISASDTMGCYRLSKAPAVKVPRPPNSFILFRQFNHPILKAEHPWMNNNQISCALGVVWKQSGAEHKEPWNARAKTLREIHKARYPEYHYNPRKSSDRKRRMTKGKAAHLQQLVAELQPVTDAASETVAASDSTNLPELHLLNESENIETSDSTSNSFEHSPDLDFSGMYVPHSGQPTGMITTSEPFSSQYNTQVDFSNEPVNSFTAPIGSFDFGFDFGATNADSTAAGDDSFSSLIENSTFDNVKQTDFFGEQSMGVSSNPFTDMTSPGFGSNVPPAMSSTSSATGTALDQDGFDLDSVIINGTTDHLRSDKYNGNDAADPKAMYNLHGMARMVYSDLRAGREGDKATGEATDLHNFFTL